MSFSQDRYSSDRDDFSPSRNRSRSRMSTFISFGLFVGSKRSYDKEDEESNDNIKELYKTIVFH